jgi:hypothetical protein
VGGGVVAERTFSHHRKAGRFRILNSDGSSFKTITENLPPIHVRDSAGSSTWRSDRNYRTNHRIFFTYVRNVDAESAALAIASAVLDEDAGAVSNVSTLLQPSP